MFSDNKKLSIRQTKRLYMFDFAGISSLILPPVLAAWVGNDGVFSILLGAGMGFLYLGLLVLVHRKMGADAGTYLNTRLAAPLRFMVYALLAVHCVLITGYALNELAMLIRHSLVRRESYLLILLVLLALSGYSVSGGLESRARVHEVLFWFVFLPLILMLAGGVTGIKTVYLTPVFTSSLSGILRGGYLVFLFYGIAFWMLFFPVNLRGRKGERPLHRSVCSAMFWMTVLMLLIYEILLGNFGSRSLAGMRYPIVTLMSTIPIPGNFIKRLDALMLGVWFFALFALVNLYLLYGVRMAQEAGRTVHSACAHIKSLLEKRPDGQGIKARRCDISPKASGHTGKSYLFAVLAVVFLLALTFGYEKEDAGVLFQRYIWYIGTPLTVLLPPVVVFLGAPNRRKRTSDR